MPRSSASRWIGLGMILAALTVAFFTLKSTQETSPAGTRQKKIERKERSILLITLDTTRADHLEPYGATDVATPTLERLAQRGVVFENAYSVAPITLVAHTSILTGLYPPQHGVRNNGTHSASAELTTLAEHLHGLGYRTAAFVSAAVLEKRYGLDQGFEVYDDDLSAGRERHPRMVPDRPAEVTVAAASQWLDTVGDDEKFFLWIHFYDPHASYSPPAPYRDEYRERLYDGEIAYMDAQIGLLLQHERISSDRELATFVVGDHGESLGEHGEQTHAILAYDSTLRIPLIASVPGGPTGKRIARPVSQVDLVPSLLDLVGLEADEQLPGQSWLPLWEGQPVATDRGLYSETYLPYYTYGWAKVKVLHKNRWKFIDAPEPELFDLHRDPRELSNRHGQEPGVAHDLGRDLAEFLEQLGDAEREASLELDTDALEKLRSLGYLAVGSGKKTDTEPQQRVDPKDGIGLHVGLERARSLARDRLFEQAVKQVKKVLQRDPNNLAALIDIAGYLERNDEVEEAVRMIEQALTLDPDYPRLYLAMSNLEARRGNPEQGLALVDRALELDPRSIDARLLRVTRLRQLGRLAEVEEALEALLEENPDRPPVLVAGAQSDLRRGDIAAAEAGLRQALERDPFLLSAWRLLGETLERAGRAEEAAEAYRSGLERQPDDGDLHARLGLALARASTGKDAEMHLREALRLSPKFRPDLHVALGGWLAEHGRFGDAEKEYDKVFEVEPENPAARNNRAIALYRRGHFEEALTELRSLVETFPEFADAHNNLAAVAVEYQDWASAERHARRAVELNPQAPQALNNLGLALSQTGRSAEARVVYEGALELEPRYWQARFNLGVLLVDLGRPQAAAESFQKVLEQVPEYPDVHFQLGSLFAGPLADRELSRRHFNAFLRLAPANHPKVTAARKRLAELPPGTK